MLKNLENGWKYSTLILKIFMFSKIHEELQWNFQNKLWLMVILKVRIKSKSKDEIKETKTENCTWQYFNNIIKFKNFDFDNIF